MSLDVSLVQKEPVTRQGTGVFVREAGKTRELTQEEVAEKFPGSQPAPLYEFTTNEVFTANITHNLGLMARNAYIYEALWRPEEKGWSKAADLIKPLEKGLKKLKADPERFEKLNPENGWGSYNNLVEFVTNYLAACREYPDAEVEVDR